MRNLLLKGIGCLSILFVSVAVNADRDRDWTWLYDSNGMFIYYAHEGSGEKFVNGGVLGLVFDKPRIWSRALFPNSPYDYKGKPVDEMIHHYEFDCSGEESRRLEGIYYFRGDEVRDFGKGRWKDADRASPMWLLMKAACN
ncbi:hypothetical protein OAM79_01340 [Litorivicinus sp.]|nr:hypothetical protein [Litorivicinus sp.]